MEPISATASVLTLLGAIGGTLKFVYNTIVDISDAPHEIQMQSKKLRSLYGVITCLVQVYENLPAEHTAGLQISGIEDFVHDLGLLKLKLEAKSSKLQNSQAHRIRESCKWLLLDRRMKKFFDSLDEWNIVLTQALWVANIAKQNQITEQISSLTLQTQKTGTSTVCSPDMIPLCINNANRNSACEPQLLGPYGHRQTPKLLCNTMRSTGLLLRRRIRVDLRIFGLDIQIGPSISRYQVQRERRIYSKMAIEGFTVALIFHIRHFIPGDFLVTLNGIYDSIYTTGLSVQTRLRFRRTLSLENPCFKAVRMGDVNYLKHKLSIGELCLTDSAPGGYTLLHYAARYAQPNIISLLIDAGADINITNDRGETSLYIATHRSGDIECSRLLLYNGADICHQDIAGRTPLHRFYSSVTRTLLISHANEIDLWLQDNRGMTVLHWASWSSRSTTHEISLVQSQAHIRSHDRPPHTTNSFLSLKDNEGRSMLHYAVQRGNLALITQFFTQPSVSDISMPDHTGKTLLHHAVENGRSAHIFDFLLDRGFDINAKDIEGRTALHFSAMVGNLSAVRRLLERGPEHQLSEMDIHGQTPLDLAAAVGHREVVEFLKTRGAKYEWTQECGSFNWNAGRERLRNHMARRAGGTLFYILIITIVFLIFDIRPSRRVVKYFSADDTVQ
jgi:ankyrin repeat protein